MLELLLCLYAKAHCCKLVKSFHKFALKKFQYKVQTYEIGMTIKMISMILIMMMIIDHQDDHYDDDHDEY